MEIANVRLVLNKQGDDLPKNNVTPAEAMLLHVLHGPINGGKTFGDEFKKVEIIGTAMVNTGEFKKVIDKPGITAKTEVAAKPHQGTFGQPGFVPAVAASPAVLGVEEVFHMEPILRPRTDSEELARLRKVYNGARDKTNKPIVDTVWPNRLKPELPQKFSDINWTEVSATGVEVAAVNYATGGLAKTSL